MKYSQESCLFECSLRFAIEQAGCLPWDYPIPFADLTRSIPVCHATVNENQIAVFNAAMNNGTNLGRCDCWADCESVTYDVQVGKLPLITRDLSVVRTLLHS